VKQILIETIVAQAVTLPIIAFTFGHYSLFALPANLLVLPFVPLAMALTFIAGLAGLLLPGLAILFGAPASALLSYMTNVINQLAGLPLAQGKINFNVLMLVFSYILLTMLSVFLWYKTRHDFRQDNIIE
jgi:competence protein ComEC